MEKIDFLKSMASTVESMDEVDKRKVQIILNTVHLRLPGESGLQYLGRLEALKDDRCFYHAFMNFDFVTYNRHKSLLSMKVDELSQMTTLSKMKVDVKYEYFCKSIYEHCVMKGYSTKNNVMYERVKNSAGEFLNYAKTMPYNTTDFLYFLCKDHSTVFWKLSMVGTMLNSVLKRVTSSDCNGIIPMYDCSNDHVSFLNGVFDKDSCEFEEESDICCSMYFEVGFQVVSHPTNTMDMLLENQGYTAENNLKFVFYAIFFGYLFSTKHLSWKRVIFLQGVSGNGKSVSLHE
jgi:hypothetical protein